jgi:hypothetical protein
MLRMPGGHRSPPMRRSILGTMVPRGLVRMGVPDMKIFSALGHGAASMLCRYDNRPYCFLQPLLCRSERAEFA